MAITQGRKTQRDVQNDIKHWMQHYDSVQITPPPIKQIADYLKIDVQSYDAHVHWPIYLAENAKATVIAQYSAAEDVLKWLDSGSVE